MCVTLPSSCVVHVYIWVRDSDLRDTSGSCVWLGIVWHCSCVTWLIHIATHCNTLWHTATYCSTLQHTATHCNTLQHIVCAFQIPSPNLSEGIRKRCHGLRVCVTWLIHMWDFDLVRGIGNTLQRTASNCKTHSNTSQHIVWHCSYHPYVTWLIYISGGTSSSWVGSVCFFASVSLGKYVYIMAHQQLA